MFHFKILFHKAAICIFKYFSLCRSDWEVRSPDQNPGRNGTTEVSNVQQISRSTDCLDLDVVCSGRTRDIHDTPTNSPRADKMRKYQAVIKLQHNSSHNSCSDMSSLDQVSLESSCMDISTTTYYTLDTKRLASKHNKMQHDR